MIAKRGAFEFCDVPSMVGFEQVIGDWQSPYFWNQAEDAFLNVKNYNFTLNVVQDALDADIELLEASAFAIAGSLIGPGGALAGLNIGANEFLASAGARTSVSGTTQRKGYILEMVPQNAVYDAKGNYSLAVNKNTFYCWIPGNNDALLKNGSQLPIPGSKFISQGTTLAMTGNPGMPVTASVVSRGFRDIYAQNLCLVMIDWGAVVRRQAGSKQGIGGVLYYPQITLLFYAGGYFLATDVTLLPGAGTIIGGITVDNSEGVITSINALTSAGPPAGQPSCFGNITPNERYDSLNVTVASGVAIITGITFDGFANVSGPTQGLFLEEQQLPFNLSADAKTMTAVLPLNASGYLIFRPSTGDVFTTRQPI